MELKKRKNSLEDGYLLHWYEIIKVIGRGGFGITYLAHDTNLDRDVAIKEFMPEDFASRESDSTVHPKTGEQKKLYDWGLERFIAEARTLAKFNHPNIVRVQSVFEENNTAYMVMEYAQGRDLSKIYKKEPTFSEERLLDTFIPIMDGLSLVHNAGFIHRDIKPANIYICDNNSPLLLDFGSARQSMGGKTKALTSLVTFGYAPYEQYNEGSGKQGPWTDIYSLGASIYFGITGKKPVDALFRGGSFLEKGIDTYEPVSILAKGDYSDNFLLAVDKALMFKIEERPRNILNWAEMLLGKREAPQLPEYMLNPPEIEHTELSWSDTELGYHTGISRDTGTMGLVDAHGKRSASSHTSTEFNDTDRSPGQNEPLAKAKASEDIGNNGTTVIRPRRTGGEKSFVQGNDENNLPNNNISLLTRLGLTWPNPEKPWLPILALSIPLVFFVILLSWILGDSSTTDDQTAKLRALQTKETQQVQQTQQTLDNSKAKTLKKNLKLAKISYTQKNYTSPSEDNAFYYYQQILKQDAENQQAKKGIREIEDQLIRLAKSAYDNKEYTIAQNYLTQLKPVNAQSLDAKFLQDQLTAITIKKSQIEAWLSEAETHINNHNYTTPESKNAFNTYSEVLNQEPDNKRALAGIKTIQNHYKDLFNKHMSLSQLSNAERDIGVMQKISVSSSDIRNMQARLKTKQQKRRVKVAPPSIKKKPVKQLPKKLNIEKVSKIIGEFKSVFQARNKNKLIRMSKLVPGRTQFIDQLFKEYKSFKIKVSKLQFISRENKASAHIDITDLIDKNGKKVNSHSLPGNWNKFDITVRYNRKNQLKVYW